MKEIDVVISKLAGVRKTANGFQARCPCHDDEHQSLSVREVEGKLLLHCFAGCSFESIIKALDLPKKEELVTPVIVATYDYKDALTGEPYQVVRYKPKDFKHRRPDGKGGWIWDKNGITPNLFMRERLEAHIIECPDASVFIVEGEKDVLSLMKVGQVATTISGGANTKWHPSLVPLFEGAKVVIIPDNDKLNKQGLRPGLVYASYVANLLYGWCASLKLIALPVKDVSDYLLDHTIDNLLNIVDNTKEYVPTGAVTRDEFMAFRGVNLYLWHEIIKRTRPKSQWS